MKALSVRQPWAWAIVRGFKPVENRTWNTNFRGMFIVHAGQRVDLAGYEFCRKLGLMVPVPADLPLGCLVGTANLDDVVKESSSKYFTGPFGWTLSEQRPFREAIPYKGRLGFFEVPNSAWRQA